MFRHLNPHFASNLNCPGLACLNFQAWRQKGPPPHLAMCNRLCCVKKHSGKHFVLTLLVCCCSLAKREPEPPFPSDPHPVGNDILANARGRRIGNAGPSFFYKHLSTSSSQNRTKMNFWDVWTVLAIAVAGIGLAAVFDSSLSVYILISLALCAYLGIRLT
jgi:hypothetical protein